MAFEDLPGSMYGAARTARTVDDLRSALGSDFDGLRGLSMELADGFVPEAYDLDPVEDAGTVALIEEHGALGWTLHEGAFFLIWRGADDPDQTYPWEIHAYVASGNGGYAETWLMRGDGRWTAVEAVGGKFE